MPIQLEITLRRGYRAAYEVEMRVARPDDAGDVFASGPLGGGPSGPGAGGTFDPAALPPLFDAHAYGVAVGSALLDADRVRETFDAASVDAGAEPLRVRLFVHPDAAPLYGVAWETARDPRAPHALLFAGERRIFSRFITSGDARALYRRPPGGLRVLVAVASPAGLATFRPNGATLAPIEEALELGRIQQALAGVGVTESLVSSQTRVTIDAITRRLADDFDVLYLACHGALVGGAPVLYLENDDGGVEPVEGEQFVRRVTDLRARPRLVVLGSCKSGGEAPGEPSVYGAGGALAALGPQLAQGGIPAVVAMQGNVALETIDAFVPAFFSYLGEHQGSVDGAVSLARATLVDKPAHEDWWAPTLLMRLRTGTLFQRTDFDEAFPHWEELWAAINNKKCTPILGPALLERHVGTRREMAARLARHFRRPLPRGDRDVLALVAQQIAIAKSAEAIRRQLLITASEMIGERFQGVFGPALAAPLPADVDPDALVVRLHALLAAAADREGAAEPHRLIAGLRLPLYLTANPDDLLERALADARTADGQPIQPVVEIHRWHPELLGTPSVYDAEPQYAPSVARPLVFHFFGAATAQESIAITQDNYIDAMVSASRKDTTKVPPAVRAALTKTTLLFLGCQIDDWSFRSLFRFIMNQEGSGLLRNRVHVAVQVDPEDSEFDDPEAARRYIARYLGDEKIRIFWGSVSDFVAALDAHRPGQG